MELRNLEEVLNGKEIDLSFEFKRENLSILTLSETKKKGQGKIEVGDEHVLIYLGTAEYQ